MIELIFVIVVMGIIGKFGVEFLAQAYKSFIFSSINNTLQSNSASAVEFIAKRLESRIKDSVVARVAPTTGHIALGSVNPNVNYTVLEWIGSDIDGFRGDITPNWSGIIDLDVGAGANLLMSPATDTNTTNTLIATLSAGGSAGAASGINDAALYFVGSNTDINMYGYNTASGTSITDQNSVMHPINRNAIITNFVPAIGNFAGIDVYEYYKLAWTAYAIVFTTTGTNIGNLTLYYDYQPWDGEIMTDGDSAIIMEDISTFRAISIGSIIKIQVCAKSDVVEEYSLCKEKTIF
jgi:hypothetical protein